MVRPSLWDGQTSHVDSVHDQVLVVEYCTRDSEHSILCTTVRQCQLCQLALLTLRIDFEDLEILGVVERDLR